jgi:cytochrome c biogenesis protein
MDEKGARFFVQCDDFRLKEFESGRAKSYESDLRLFARMSDGSAGPELARQTIRVNEPLRYAGLTFYQASYQQLERAPRARVTVFDKTTGTQQTVLAGPGQPIEAADGLSYQVVDHQEDFAGMGPAVQIVRIEEPPGTPRASDGKPSADAKVTSFWVFSKRPEFDRDNRPDRFAFQFDRITPFYATGLQIARDPSTPIVYLGCFALFAGIGIAFYTSHKRVWAHVASGKISLGGAAHRNLEAFSGEFEELCDALGVPRPAPRKGAQAAA